MREEILDIQAMMPTIKGSCAFNNVFGVMKRMDVLHRGAEFNGGAGDSHCSKTTIIAQPGSFGNPISRGSKGA